MSENKVIKYDDIPEFVKALEQSEIERLYTFVFRGSLFGFSGKWLASFIDNKETIHGLIYPTLENLGEVNKPIYDLIEKRNIPEVDGAIKILENGDIQQVFETDRPEEEENIQKSYNDWIEAISKLPIKNTLIQYLKEKDKTIIDATRGKQHFITALDGERKRTLEYTLEILKGYKTRDNTPIIEWYSNIKKE